jgi:uncharacterized membrane protein YgcG
VSKRATSDVSLWVTCIAAILFAIAIGASFPWGYVIVAVVAAVVAFQMGRKVGKDPVWTLFINKRPEKPGRSSSRSDPGSGTNLRRRGGGR